MLQDSENVERNELEPVMGMIRLQSGKRLKIKYVWRKLINKINIAIYEIFIRVLHCIYIARVAEMSLSAKPLDEMQCFKRIVCIVGATGGSLQKVDNDAEIVVTKNQPITLAKGIEQFVNMLQSMTETIETDMDEFPIIQQIIGRYINDTI